MPPGERTAFLEEACGEDSELLEEVRSLLAHEESDTVFFASLSERLAAAMVDSAPAEGGTPDEGDGGGPSPASPRFAPGTVLAGRFRIVARLGRGGMGEVYRADDLKLGTSVALKFLPRALIRDRIARERLAREVRLARGIAHPNVCRVFDLVEADGEVFLTMEYVDGEDLGSLLRRIGRLPEDKAVDLARQICAGLAAAHELGILHRDLKPANIMVDGRGRVRITDFGLAAAARAEDGGPAVTGREAREGTPAYMAPEQLAGKEATVGSDLYALGTVLYEMFTGRQAFFADSVAEYRRLHETQIPDRPSTHLSGMDPAAERVILRCLQKDPLARPASALEVAAALPGGDPLSAALAAGEIPSPEMVAAAGARSALDRRYAAATFLAVVLLLLLAARLAGELGLIQRADPPLEPAVLRARVLELLEDLGLEPGDDQTEGFTNDPAFPRINWLAFREGQLWGFLNGREDGRLLYWWRGSQTSLAPRLAVSFLWNQGRSSAGDPPLEDAGGKVVITTQDGRLRFLRNEGWAWRFTPFSPAEHSLAEKGETAGEEEGTSSRLWETLVRAAGLDPGDREESVPRVEPHVQADLWLAADFPLPEDPEQRVHVEFGAREGKPVFFAVFDQWEDEPGGMLAPWFPDIGLNIFGFLLLWVLVPWLALPFALRNLRNGTGDRRTATRLAVLLASLRMVGWSLGGSHQDGFFQELGLVSVSLGQSLFMAFLVWTSYLALEPVVRRSWPQTLISWSRAMGGMWRDPLVGRHVLLGVLLGAYQTVAVLLESQAPAWFGGRSFTPGAWQVDFHVLEGPRHWLAALLQTIPEATFFSLVIILLLAGMRVILRKPWLAGLATWIVLTLLLTAWRRPFPLFLVSSGLLQYGVWVLLLMRAGLTPFTVMLVVHSLLLVLPIHLKPGVWWGGAGTLGLAAVLALALVAWRLSIHRRPGLRTSPASASSA